MAPPPQGAYRNWRTSGGKLRYSLTGGGWGAAWSGLRRTHDATHLRSAYGRGAPEEMRTNPDSAVPPNEFRM